MCIRDRYQRRVHGDTKLRKLRTLSPMDQVEIISPAVASRTNLPTQPWTSILITENDLVDCDEVFPYKRVPPGASFFTKTLLHTAKVLDELELMAPKDFLHKIKERNEGEAMVDILDISKLKLYCFYTINSDAQGFDGICHGGFSCTIVDQLGGILSYMVNDLSPCATFNLQMTFRKPVYLGRRYSCVVETEKIEGRNIYLKSTIASDEGLLCTETYLHFKKVNWKFRSVEAGKDNLTSQDILLRITVLIHAYNVHFVQISCIHWSYDH
eukprot:TRINITY_DN1940_c0_g1_i1.p1 TRINITY_DN1940_c0_g1~~TRINITY_DN1940_c0_g1_i1.p1  ORF type:complete len:296 (+),score=49.54 TRINITY_DN1940_c0_g1_i1:84-890(+)